MTFLYIFFPNLYSLPLFIIVLVLFYLYLTKNDSYWEKRNVPHEKPLFLVGNLWDVFKGDRQIGKHLGYLYTKYSSPYFGIFIMGKPYLVLRSPELIKTITIRDFNNFDDRTFACDKKADNMTGNSLFIIRNPDWRNIRNKLTPIFTSGKLKLMVPLMKRAGNELNNYLNLKVDETLEMKDVCAKYMTDLVSSCFFGLDTNSFGEKDSEFRQISKKMFEIDLFRAFAMFSYFFVPKLVSWFKLKLMDTSFLQNIFLDTLKHRERTNVRRNDFVDLLLNLRENFEKEGDTQFGTDQMISQAITFFTAGFETTSNAVAFTLYELCLEQKCQDRVRQEIRELIKSTDDITFENIQSMKYLDMVVAETLRRYPFGPFLNRKCKKDYLIKETGLVIEKDTPILIPIDGLHNDPNFYSNPEHFDPERFAEGTKQKTQSCIYMPFGSGPRNCIGDRFGLLAAKVGLIYVLKEYKVERCMTTPVPLVLEAKSPFMVPVNGLPMRIRRI